MLQSESNPFFFFRSNGKNPKNIIFDKQNSRIKISEKNPKKILEKKIYHQMHIYVNFSFYLRLLNIYLTY